MQCNLSPNVAQSPLSDRTISLVSQDAHPPSYVCRNCSHCISNVVLVQRSCQMPLHREVGIACGRWRMPYGGVSGCGTSARSWSKRSSAVLEDDVHQFGRQVPLQAEDGRHRASLHPRRHCAQQASRPQCPRSVPALQRGGTSKV